MLLKVHKNCLKYSDLIVRGRPEAILDSQFTEGAYLGAS
jgi:hypothetical protein